MRHSRIILSFLLMFFSVSIVEAELRFDGKSGQVQIPDLRCRGESPLTIEFIVTPDSPTTTYSRVISNLSDPSGQSKGLSVGISKGYWLVTIATERGLRRVQSDHPVVYGARVHIATVFDQDLVTLFVNGEKNEAIIKLTHKMIASDKDFLLGCEWGERSKYAFRFSGDLEAIRLSSTGRYKRDFKPPEKLSVDKETLLNYQFDQDPGEKCRDLSGLGFDGDVSGLQWVAPEPDRSYPDIEDLQKTIGLHEVQRKIDGGGTLKNLFYTLTADFEVQEKGKKVGVWSFPSRKKLKLELDGDSLGPVVLTINSDGTLTGSQKNNGREVEWSLHRIHIEMLWHNTRSKGNRTLGERDFALFSNGRLGAYDHPSWKWERRGNTLYFHWEPGNSFEMRMSRDEQTYRGVSPKGETLVGVRLD